MTTNGAVAGTTLETPSVLEGTKKFNAWQDPGPAAHDFRSDVFTTPTESMLEAIKNTTLFDDVFMEDTTTVRLESHVASLAGHEAGLLVMSGTMGNQVALRTHLVAPPHSVLCDVRGHINVYEGGGVSTWSGAMVIPVQPSNGHHLTLEDIQSHAVLSDDVHACPTKVISLENTLNGMIYPLAELKRIAGFARTHNIRLHLDGARVWEAATATSTPLQEITSLFDSVSLCFSKGLGAPIGSVVVGSKSFITHARRIRKMLGGGTRQAGVISAPALVAVNETFGRDPTGKDGKLRSSHQRAREVADLWTSKGGRLANPTETNMVWLDLAAEGLTAAEFAQMGKDEGITVRGGRMVIHYQISDDSVKRLEKVMDRLFAKRHNNRNGNGTPAS